MGHKRNRTKTKRENNNKKKRKADNYTDEQYESYKKKQKNKKTNKKYWGEPRCPWRVRSFCFSEDTPVCLLVAKSSKSLVCEWGRQKSMKKRNDSFLFCKWIFSDTQHSQWWRLKNFCSDDFYLGATRSRKITVLGTSHKAHFQETRTVC